MNNKILIIDFNVDGHWVEYLNHLIKSKNNLVKECFHFRLSKEFTAILGLENKNIDHSIISDKKIKEYYYSSFEKKNEILKNEILSFKKINFDHVFLLNLSVCFKWFFFPKKISGIIYNSPLNFEFKISNLYSIINQMFRLFYLARFLKTENIFLLNNLNKSKFLKILIGYKLKYLVDPLNFYNDNLEYIDFKKTLLTNNKIILLHIGSSQTYKGTNDFLEVLKKIKLKNTTSIVAGKLDKDQMATIDSINNSIIHIDNFIDEIEFKSLFKISNVVIITNKNTSFSSGILNHALFFENFIIAPKKDYFFKVLKDQKNCQLFRDKNELKNIIKNLDSNLEIKKFKNNVPLHFPVEFSNILISNLCVQ